MHVPKDTASVVLMLALLTEATLVAVGQIMIGLDPFFLLASILVLAAGALAVFLPRPWTRVAASLAFVLFAALVVRLRMVADPDRTPFAVALEGNLGIAAIAVAAVGAAAGIVLVGLKTPAASST